jgi:hypothetical protein
MLPLKQVIQEKSLIDKIREERKKNWVNMPTLHYTTPLSMWTNRKIQETIDQKASLYCFVSYSFYLIRCFVFLSVFDMIHLFSLPKHPVYYRSHLMRLLKRFETRHSCLPHSVQLGSGDEKTDPYRTLLPHPRASEWSQILKILHHIFRISTYFFSYLKWWSDVENEWLT